MNSKKKTIGCSAFWIIAIFLAVPGNLYAAGRITLTQALEIAVKNNPSVAVSQSEVAAAQAGVTQAKSAVFPQVSASAGYDHTWYDNHGGSMNDSDGYDSYAAGLSVSQYLFDFGKTPAEIEKSIQSLVSTEIGLKTIRNTIVKAVKASYFEALKNQQLVAVNQEALDVRQRHLAQAKALYAEGMRPKIDITRSQVEVSQARLKLVLARYALQRAVKALETLLGGPPVSGDYELVDEAPTVQPLPALASLVALGLGERPEPAALKSQIKAAEAGRLSAERSAWPRLNADGAYGHSGDGFPLDRRWQLGMNLTWPLFTGFRQTGQVAAFDADVNRLSALLDSRILSVTEEVTQAFLGVAEAEEAITTAEIALRQAEENLAMAKGRYAAGVSDAIEFSDAQVLYTETKSALVQAVYAHQKTMADLEYAVGGVLK